MTIEPRQHRLDSIFAETFPKTKTGNHKSRGNGPALRLVVTDNQILDAAMSAKNGDKFRRLWEGRWEGDYASHSEADQALMNLLAFWTGNNPARMDSLFRQSDLKRPKWEQREGYRSRTINSAIKITRQTWNPATTGIRTKARRQQ